MRVVVVAITLLLPGTAIGQIGSTANSSAPSSIDGFNEPIHGPKEKGIKPPKVKRSPDPEYAWNRNDVRGRMVVLWLVVGSDGLPHNVRVARNLRPDLDKAAIDAVNRWTFSPATKDGKPIAVQINVEVAFQPY